MNNYMFGDKKNKIKDTERSLISETVSIEGTINSSGAIDVAGLVKGPVISKEIVIRETGSITGSIEGDSVEIHGHMDGKISGDDVIVGSTGTVKGDIDFGNNLKTENGADIDGYIKKTHGSKSKLAPDFLFKKDYSFGANDDLELYEDVASENHQSIKKIITQNKYIEIELPNKKSGSKFSLNLKVKSEYGKTGESSISVLFLELPIFFLRFESFEEAEANVLASKSLII